MFDNTARKNLSKKLSNSIRFLALDSINLAKAKQLGICLWASPMITELFTNHLQATPQDSKWINRDRFVMSIGHGSALLYSTLYHMGYDLSLNDIKQFRQSNSKTPGFPEFGKTDGVDATSEQGIAQAVGIAIAEKFLARKFNKDDHRVFDHYTFAMISRKDLQKGISYEAMAIAGQVGLEKLILLYDSNDYESESGTTIEYDEDIKARCKSQNWNYIIVRDGENQKLISDAIASAKRSGKPTLIEVKTFMVGDILPAKPQLGQEGIISDEERIRAADYHNYEQAPFVIEADVKKIFENIIDSKIIAFSQWNEMMSSYKKQYPSEYKKLKQLKDNKFEIDLSKLSKVELNEKSIVRSISSDIIKVINEQHPAFICSASDLKNSNKVFGVGELIENSGYNINFGPRETAMSAIANGIVLHGVAKSFSSTFLVYSDYTKAAIRLSALQNLPVSYIFTHDSIINREFGPSNGPIEHLSSLRAIPNHNVMRPANKQEAIFAYQEAINSTSTPTSIILSKEETTSFSKISINQFKKGAYVVKESSNKTPTLTIVATGSEVSLAINALNDMPKVISKKIAVVSMPSTFMFDNQTKAYKNKIIPARENTVFIEQSDGSSGYKYAKYVYSLFNQFGYSVSKNDARKKTKFTKNDIIKYIEKILKG